MDAAFAAASSSTSFNAAKFWSSSSRKLAHIGRSAGIEVRFLIAGVGLEDATREAFHLADALVTVALDGQEGWRIEITDVTEAEPQKN